MNKLHFIIAIALLVFQPIASATPGLVDRQPRRQFEINQEGTRLTFRGSMSRGYAVGEVWEKVEDWQ